MSTYSSNEMMALAAGRFIKDGDIVFAGTGVAMLAAAAAKRIHAPKAVVFFETGGDRKGTRLNSSDGYISYAVFCLKKIKLKLIHLWEFQNRITPLSLFT